VALGVDLAWSESNGSGACALDPDGRVVDERILVTDDEILDWVNDLASESAVVAVDAPLLVPNETGRRPCESELSREYGSRWAATHSSNRQLLLNRHGAIRGEDLAGELRRSGFSDLWSQTQRTLLEVYPHPAIIEAFGLPHRLAYKKGRIAERRAGLRRLDVLILSLATADPPFIGSPVEITDTMTGPELKSVEDLLDARICAWVAAVWNRYGSAGVRVFGDATSGHIAVPIGSVVAS
jgi:predicted RNase H-like nuclease